MRMSLLSTFGSKINRRLRRLRRRWTDKSVSGLEIGKKIRIFDIVCPLRYDILVRADFVELLAENDKLLVSELEEILENRDRTLPDKPQPRLLMPSSALHNTHVR